MRVTKRISVETEVEVDVSAEDCARAIAEDPESKHTVLLGIDTAARFLRAIPDDLISEIPDEAKKVISDFLDEQRKRFQKRGSE